jgi:hypothetical protein
MTESVWIFHNSNYDERKVIIPEMQRYNIPVPQHWVCCTLENAKRLIPKKEVKNYKLGTLCEHFDINLGDRFHEADFDTIRSLATLYDSKMVEYYDSENLDSLLTQVDNFSSDEKEGWVIRMRDENGKDFRVKIKCTDYVLLHRVISKRISPNAVIEALAYGKYDDFYSKVPDAFKDIVKGFYLETVNYVNTRTTAAMNWYYQMMEELKDQLENYPENYIKKLQMVWISENVPKCIASDVRNMVNEKETQYLIRRGSPYRHAEILKLKNQHEKAIRQAKERQNNLKKEE